LVPGWAIAEGQGRFCSADHAMLWAWTHERKRFPQATEDGAAWWTEAMLALWWEAPTEAARKFRQAWRDGTPRKTPLTSPAARPTGSTELTARPFAGACSARIGSSGSRPSSPRSSEG